MLFVLSALVFGIVSSAEATICKLDSDCSTDQCCYIMPQFMVVSKRQTLLQPVMPTVSDTGVCENYRVEHEHCGPLETANGHCGCGAGLSCQFVPAPTATLATAILQGAARRVAGDERSIYMPGPGSYQCEAV